MAEHSRAELSRHSARRPRTCACMHSCCSAASCCAAASRRSLSARTAASRPCSCCCWEVRPASSRLRVGRQAWGARPGRRSQQRRRTVDERKKGRCAWYACAAMRTSSRARAPSEAASRHMPVRMPGNRLPHHPHGHLICCLRCSSSWLARACCCASTRLCSCLTARPCCAPCS